MGNAPYVISSDLIIVDQIFILCNISAVSNEQEFLFYGGYLMTHFMIKFLSKI